MNLSKRAAFLVFPVIVAGYTLAALQAYSSHASSITKLEQTRLDNRLIELKSSYGSYQSFVDGFILNVSNGDKLRDFLQKKDDAYRIISLRNGIDRYVSKFQKKDLGVASFAVVDPELKAEYYFEDSTDPFSTVGPEQLKFAEQLFREGRFEGRIHKIEENTSQIIQGLILHTSTFTKPLRINFDQSVLLLASIEPVMYDRLIAETKAEYDAKISYLQAPPAETAELHAWTELEPGHILRVEPDESYLAGLKTDLMSWLSLAVFMLSMFTFALLMYLIRKFVTHPVSQLDHQLELVVQNKLKNIEKPTQKDEIGRLGLKFHGLYKELSHMLDHTRAMSRTDSLTGLPNRVAFNDVAQHRIAEAEKKQQHLSFIYIDLDNFKFVNDKYGHDVGDNLLRAFAHKMLNLLARHQSAEVWMEMFRLSGDEFSILLQGLEHPDIEGFSRKILLLFDSGFHFDQGTFPVTASLGIATYPEDGHTVTQLISNADLAMYQAKYEGKNRYARYSRKIAEHSRRQVDIEEQLNKIDPDKEFHLLYMPIVDRNERCASCEVLLRWKSPILGNVGPAEFVPIAESSGQFIKIDYWVIQKAISTLPQIRDYLGENVTLSINVSSAQLGSDQIKDYLNETLQKYGVPGSDIEIEITETYNLEQLENILDRLNIFRDQEFAIVIDDFGVGNTSLMQLIDSPIDRIKLDRDFVERVTRAHKDELITAFINLCHIQNIEVTAEGIETEQQYRLLLDAGCDNFQGYYFSKPRPLADLAGFAPHDDIHAPGIAADPNNQPQSEPLS